MTEWLQPSGVQLEVSSSLKDARFCMNAVAQRAALDEVATDSYLYQMRSVGVKLLKNKLSEYLRLAAGGETVLVTDRDRVVAELIPPREGRSAPIADAFLAEAVRQGWLTAPVMRDDRPPPRLPVASAAQLLSELADDRAGR
jgi:antitoxin (DNA-binding transcriptional repressor) of toxin-antitoxin stability system